MVYAENHDEARYIVDYGKEAAEAAAAATFTLPGAPMVYAGQEFCQRGRRDDLAWDHADDGMREYFSSLADVRKHTPALSSDGELERVDYAVEEGWDDRVVAYARVTDAEAVVVVLNFGEEPATVSVPEATAHHDRIADEDVGADGSAVRVDSAVVLPADSLVR
jgi:glycosidase